MNINELSQTLQQLEQTASRLEITSILAQVFKDLEIDEVRPVCYLLQGQILPQYYGLEFQVAIKTIIKVLGKFLPEKTAETQSLFGEEEAPSSAVSEVEQRYKKIGDLGQLTEEVMSIFAKEKNTEVTSLSVKHVYDQLLAVANDTGEQSQQRKQDKIFALLESLDPVSAKFVVRILLGRLRLGFSDMTMIDALSWAMTGSKDERTLLEDAYQKRADIGQLATEYLAIKDAEKRQKFLTGEYSIQLGVPVVPALCQRLNSAAEVIEKMTEVIVEPKYDGLRVQIHIQKKDDKHEQIVRTFTRNLEESSLMFPELGQILNELKCDNCVLDAEVIGYDLVTGDLLPFQQTTQRKRKHGVAEKAAEIPVRFYVFDVLYVDGKDLLAKPLTERKEILNKLFDDGKILVHTPEVRTKDPTELQNFHINALADGLEGVVMKQTTAGYQSGRKGWSWVKMKEAEGTTGKLNDTLDVVVLGYYMGRGKRAEFGIGAFLVGILNEESQQILTLAKIGTGLTEETLVEVKKRCDKLVTPDQPVTYQVAKALIPDFWCLPGLVVEVAADELTTSPLHTAGQALRFPRFMSFREDKEWSQITTSAELKTMHIA